MQRLKWLLPLALFVPLLMAPSGGYPTQPLFATVQASGVGAPPCTNPAVNPFVICAPAGQSGLMELSGNGNVPGTSSLAVGQTAAGVGTVQQRGTGSILNIGVNGTQLSFDTSGNITAPGTGTVPWAFKAIAVTLASDSTKTSTTTQALDATLQFTLPAGTYLVELNGTILPAGIAAAAGGFAGCLQAAGTIPVLSAGSYSFALYVTNVAFSTQWFGEQTITSTCTGGSQVIYSSQTTGGTSFDQMVFRGMLTTTTSGTFGLSWAQSASSATPTTLKQGTTLIATRVL
jgi:hypothetical protein